MPSPMAPPTSNPTTTTMMSNRINMAYSYAFLPFYLRTIMIIVERIVQKLPNITNTDDDDRRYANRSDKMRQRDGQRPIDQHQRNQRYQHDPDAKPGPSAGHRIV